MNDKSFSVYRHIFPSGKSYIGITSLNPNDRWRDGHGYKGCPAINNAIKKYGWDNVDHIIMFDNLTKDEACKKEIELIQKYNTLVPNGYNIDKGGSSVSYACKKIICFNENKECHIFESIKEAANFVGVNYTSISKAIERPYKRRGGFFIYAN